MLIVMLIVMLNSGKGSREGSGVGGGGGREMKLCLMEKLRLPVERSTYRDVSIYRTSIERRVESRVRLVCCVTVYTVM